MAGRVLGSGTRRGGGGHGVHVYSKHPGITTFVLKVDPIKHTHCHQGALGISFVGAPNPVAMSAKQLLSGLRAQRIYSQFLLLPIHYAASDTTCRVRGVSSREKWRERLKDEGNVHVDFSVVAGMLGK